MDLSLEQFPIRADRPADDRFYYTLHDALRRELGLPDDAVIACGGGWGARPKGVRTWPRPGRTLRGGLRVPGTRKSTYAEVVLVGYALFDDDDVAIEERRPQPRDARPRASVNVAHAQSIRSDRHPRRRARSPRPPARPLVRC